ncbi:DUF3606 domain-containing protein [Luteibacter sp. UNCMF366Tsu5.1]|uniref:DUF3606 domain-containing protein n=1 Tax=Luteibacter sp. UNCMF366Tsu5.1 TaxID=1502758 RepID=UPI000908FDAD|nr:DUF3606 domain-containing protein [Luteibacter sp. UNCMF366Tsu5.1]SFW63595.1 Protein of unknown function [Luteibacter sp. UNCMF366Tsu5.1]
MSDDKSERGPADAQRINVHEPYEVSYWTGALGVSEARLREVVAEVGVMADDVRRALDERGIDGARPAARR